MDKKGCYGREKVKKTKKINKKTEKTTIKKCLNCMCFYPSCACRLFGNKPKWNFKEVV